MSANEELVDYEEDASTQNLEPTAAKTKEVKKGSYVGIHSASFNDFLMRSELIRAIQDCGFEHPSEVQQECIPQAMYGTDIICQAKAGMGKTAVFVLAILQQLQNPVEGEVDSLILCHTRELAFQICQEFLRFAKYIPDLKNRIAVFFGGIPIQTHRDLITTGKPLIIVGTPGRVLQLVNEKSLKLDHLKRFVIDECDQVLGAGGGREQNLDMRRDTQAIFKQTPHEKQVMMFSATFPKEIKSVCKKFTQNALELYVDDDSKLVLHGLQQYYCKLEENQKNRRLNQLLDALEFNQVVIFVNGIRRCTELCKLLNEHKFPATAIHGGLKQDERIKKYKEFKDFKSRILVSTDIFGRGVDFERVNIVINYDMPLNDDQYLHRVGRSGRFGTKGLAVTFVSSEDDAKMLEKVQSKFIVEVPQLPDTIDVASYLNA